MHNAMHKLSNFTGRSGWENTFGVNRSQHELNRTPTFPQQLQPGQQRPTPTHSHSHPSAPVLAQPPQFPPATPISWCFKVPLNHALAGPDPTKVIYATQGASQRWTRPETNGGAGSDDESAPEDCLLPVHKEHIDDLRRRCARIEADSKVKAIVTVGRAATLGPVPFMPASSPASVAANVCLHGRDIEIVGEVREAILNGSPITLVCCIPCSRVSGHQNLTNNSNRPPCPLIEASFSRESIGSSMTKSSSGSMRLRSAQRLIFSSLIMLNAMATAHPKPMPRNNSSLSFMAICSPKRRPKCTFSS
jgi:hypothetical protein